jgi:hypothetical protein
LFPLCSVKINGKISCEAFWGTWSVQAIRIPEAQWGKVWRILVASGPISCIGPEPIYLVSARQVRLLRRKNLPFKVASPPDGHPANPDLGEH